MSTGGPFPGLAEIRNEMQDESKILYSPNYNVVFLRFGEWHIAINTPEEFKYAFPYGRNTNHTSQNLFRNSSSSEAVQKYFFFFFFGNL
jgi:hypothetical protein